MFKNGFVWKGGGEWKKNHKKNRKKKSSKCVPNTPIFIPSFSLNHESTKGCDINWLTAYIWTYFQQ